MLRFACCAPVERAHWRGILRADPHVARCAGLREKDATVASSCKVLMIFPRFNPKSFWSYEGVIDILGARYPASPLGMITLAALLPAEWSVRLINRNTEDFTPEDLDWADMVMTGGMMAQQADCLRVVQIAQAAAKPVVIGGPDATSSPHIYACAEFRVLGEAEMIIDDFVEAWERGDRSGCFTAPKFKADVTRSPIPRFDLLKFDHYLYVGVQFSRGCPFTCEFCDIIELYGRVPRTKTPDQMLAELDRLYALGYRGYLDFVDDNLIGNKKAVKAFLPHLIAWQKKHRYPFVLTTEASLNVADDSQLLQLMKEANFFAIFIGIESAEPETLVHMQKKQNTRRSIPESVHRIYAAGISVYAGFIIGFDTDRDDVADSQVRLITEAAIPVAMIGLLWALPTTQLTRRLEREGRLHAGHDTDKDGRAGDQFYAGLNFETVRPRAAVIRSYIEALTGAYAPAAYFGRVRDLMRRLDPVDLGPRIALRDGWREFDRFLKLMWEVTRRRPEARAFVWSLLAHTLVRKPRAIRTLMTQVTFYLYLPGIVSYVIANLRRQLAEVESGAWRPVLAPPPKAELASELAEAGE